MADLKKTSLQKPHGLHKKNQQGLFPEKSYAHGSNEIHAVSSMFAWFKLTGILILSKSIE